AAHVARVAAAWRTLPEGNEASLYRAAGFLPVPPELRDDPASLRAAPDLPRLVELDDICGLVHCHTVYSDGSDTIEAMALATEAVALGPEVSAFPSPTTPEGVDPSGLRPQWHEIGGAQGHAAIPILRGVEAGILTGGSPNLPDNFPAQLDVSIAITPHHDRQ